MPRHLDRHQVTVHGAAGCVRCDRKFAAKLLLVDRHKSAAAVGQPAKDTERAGFGAIDEFYDPAARFLAVRAVDADERVIADARDFAGRSAPRRDDADDRWRAMRALVPFRRPRQKLAVTVAAGNIDNHDGRQRAGMVQALAPAFDAAVFGEITQHAVERGAVRILGAESARNLTHADFAAAFADEGDKLFRDGRRCEGRRFICHSSA